MLLNKLDGRFVQEIRQIASVRRVAETDELAADRFPLVDFQIVVGARKRSEETRRTAAGIASDIQVKALLLWPKANAAQMPFANAGRRIAGIVQHFGQRD